MDDRATIYRSGDLYIVRRGGLGRLIRGGQAGAAAPFGSLVAHAHVDEPWAEVPDGEPLPDAVAKAAAGGPGWEPPGWLEGE